MKREWASNNKVILAYSLVFISSKELLLRFGRCFNAGLGNNLSPLEQPRQFKCDYNENNDPFKIK